MKKLERFGPPNWRALSPIAACVLAVSGGGLARADVLYDSTEMTDNQTYDGFMICVIGGQGSFGGDPNNVKDSQVAEDFVLNAAYDITSVTGDFFTHPDENAVPEDGILIEFFADLTGTPSEEPAAAIFATEFTTVHFTDTVFGFRTKSNIARLTVDLTGEGITLGPGTWWLSIVPVNASAGADAFAYQQLRTKFLVNGSITHARDGGMDHGTGEPGIYGFDDWTPIDQIGGGVFDPGDIAMRIEGTLVKPNCPQDLDGNGIVGASDLLSLLASWGPCKGCPADFDGNGTVGASDLLALLANWGPCI